MEFIKKKEAKDTNGTLKTNEWTFNRKRLDLKRKKSPKYKQQFTTQYIKQTAEIPDRKNQEENNIEERQLTTFKTLIFNLYYK